jgi:uncharacterized membrane protein YeaQ/YmgE (transglycosylase-associated protein family)
MNDEVIAIAFQFSVPRSSFIVSYREQAMTLTQLLVLLLIAGICGSLGQAISGFSRGGCLVSIALGFIGALIGMWLASQLRLPELFAIQIGTTRFPIIWSIIGSALFVAVISLLTRRNL